MPVWVQVPEEARGVEALPGASVGGLPNTRSEKRAQCALLSIEPSLQSCFHHDVETVSLTEAGLHLFS